MKIPSCWSNFTEKKGGDVMQKQIVLGIVFVLLSFTVEADNDQRELVSLPEMLRAHMLANMRNHLETIDLILLQLFRGELDAAAETAEQRLGMSSLDKHGATHLAKFMPAAMKQTGTRMHHASSRFALRAQEGELPPAYKALQEVTSVCVACHAAYPLRLLVFTPVFL
jgi:hypothetical protein